MKLICFLLVIVLVNSEPLNPDSESQKVSNPDSESLKASNPDFESQKASDSDSESLKASNPDSESLKDSNPDSESQKASNPDSESRKASNPDSESQKASKLDSDSLKASNPDSEPPTPKSKTCWSCEYFVTYMKSYFEKYTPGKEAEDNLVSMCSMTFGYIPFMEAQCKTCVTNDLDLLRSALFQKRSTKSICSDVLKIC